MDGSYILCSAYLWVALAAGALRQRRSLLAFSGLVAQRYGETFPWGTLVINVTGSFIIGILGALVGPEGRLDPQTRIFTLRFLMVGVCGGYTTFSSFSLQTLNLMQNREWLHAGGNIVLSVVLCLIAVWLGFLLGAALTSTKPS